MDYESLCDHEVKLRSVQLLTVPPDKLQNLLTTVSRTLSGMCCWVWMLLRPSVCTNKAPQTSAYRGALASIALISWHETMLSI
jgi:hypothetical protein